MFYSQFILAKKGPLGTIWIAAHLERKLRKNQVTETNISVSVDSILFPEVPIALRLSGHLLLGVVRIYSRKVNYLFHDCSEALVKIKQAFHAGAVDLPPEAATAPFHSITLPETFDLDEFEPLPDREMHLLHSNGAVDHHVTTREQITLQDPLEDNSYMESQFGLDERFPEGDVPRMGIDFDEDLLEKPSREATPAAITLEEDEVLPANMGDGMDYDQMDRMEAMDMDDHHEPGTPALGMDNMDMDYHTEVDGMGDGDLNRSPGVLEDSDNEHHEHHAEEIEMDNFEPDLNKPDQLEPATPGSLEHEEQELKGDLLGEVDKIENVEEEGGMIMDKDVQNLDDEEEQAPVTLLAEKDEPAKQEEEEEEEIPREDEVKLPELEGEGEKLEVEGASEGPIEENSKEEEANKQEVPEYETVMSAVEIPNQEPDVFDLDQDMEKEMPRTDYKDQDVFMEDGDAVLIEEGDDRMQFEDPQIAVDEPASPMNSPSMPMFNPDALPGDDDVLASLLGRGTPALKLIPTPTETAVGKPRRKQGQRKRKIVMDMNTILPADVMREQLMNTDDIRRVRKKAPCTRQELWIVQKDALGQQIFYEHSVPGLCGDLRVLFQRVYVAGHADLPLAEDDLPLSDDVQAELFATEEVPDLHPVPSVEDVVKEMNEGPVATAGPVIEDQAIHFFDDQGLQTDVASPVKIVDEHLQGDSVARRVDDLDEAESQLHADQLGGPFADVVDPLVVEEVNEPPGASHAPEEENKEEDLTDLPVSESKAVETSPRSPTIEEPLAVEEQEPAREETEEIALPLKEADVDISAVTAEVGPEPGFQVVEAEHIAEIMNEDMTEVSEVLPEVLPEAQPKTLSPTIRQEPMVEEQGEDEEERVASAGHDLEVHSPSREVEDQIAEEEPNEELGFLADTRDTVFLAADDDDLCEEAEDFQDANDYGQKETLAQDNSGWSARTRAVGHYLRTTLESKDAHMKKREEEGIAKLGLEQILVGKTRKEAARMFFETLVLKTKDYIHVEQDSPYCDIQISARPKLLKANF